VLVLEFFSACGVSENPLVVPGNVAPSPPWDMQWSFGERSSACNQNHSAAHHVITPVSDFDTLRKSLTRTMTSATSVIEVTTAGLRKALSRRDALRATWSSVAPDRLSLALALALSLALSLAYSLLRSLARSCGCHNFLTWDMHCAAD